MLRCSLIILLSSLLLAPLFAQDEDAAIREVILEAYINGVYNDGIPRNIELGFSTDFRSVDLVDKQTKVRPLSHWQRQVQRQLNRGDYPRGENNRVSAQYHRIEINGRQAMVKLNRLEGGKAVAVEYLVLFRYPEGWMILSLYSHPLAN